MPAMQTVAQGKTTFTTQAKFIFIFLLTQQMLCLLLIP